MAIKAIVEKLEDVDEKYRDLYTEKGGKFELTGVEGMKSEADVQRIHASLKKERDDHKATRDKYAFLGDLEPSKVQEMLDKYPELETAAGGKLDEAAIQKLVEGRLNTATAPLKRELDKLRKEHAEKEGKLTEYAQRDRQRAISDAVRTAASKVKMQDSAVDDAILLAERMFEISDDGVITTKDGMGVTPGVSPEVWLQDMQSKRPHWWGPSQGGGAGGARTGGVGGENPWSAEGWNMTKQGAVLKENRARAEQMAKAAGTTIGGPKPQAKK